MSLPLCFMTFDLLLIDDQMEDHHDGALGHAYQKIFIPETLANGRCARVFVNDPLESEPGRPIALIRVDELAHQLGAICCCDTHRSNL